MYTLNGSSTTYLYGSNADFFKLSTPIGTKDIGEGLATVQAIMKDYPTIKSAPISFTVVILESIVPSISDHVYYSNA